MRKVKVICPQCGCICDGEVTIHSFGDTLYYANCKKCDYDITESEWDEVEILPFDNATLF